MLKQTIPLLPSLNIRASIDFYEAKLGFSGTNYGNYGILRYKNIEIHLVIVKDKNNNGSGCLIMVDDIEDFYTRLSSKGLININGQLADKPWGKEFTIIDNNANPIRFGQIR